LIALIKFLFKRQVSNFYIIIGRRGSGKTDFALFLLEILEHFGITKHFATNIKIYDSSFPIEPISDLESLTEWASETKGKKVYVLDEAGRAFKRRKPMSAINVEIIDKLQILRKFKLSLLFSVPAKSYLDKASFGSDVLDGVFKKLSYKNPKIALYKDMLETFTLRLWQIPKTLIQFDTWDSAPFNLKSKNQKPKFKDTDLNYLWNYAEGGKIVDSGLHPQEFRRILKKYLKESLKQQSPIT